MKVAETVTFGGSGLDRAAQMRGDLGAIIAAKTTRTIVLWRGKVAVHDDGGLIYLPREHPALSDEADPIVFLGLDEDGAAVLAQELIDWSDPDEAAMMGVFLDTSCQRHPDIEGGGFVELRHVMTQLSSREAELAATARGLFEWHRSHRFCARCGAASDIAMSGWQRDCHSCETHHFPRTDPVVIMLVTNGNSVLLGRSPGWPDGMYSLLAGFVEPGETIEAAVRREVFEESGVRVGEVHYLASQPWPFPSSLMIGCSGVATTRDITVDPAEIEHAVWVSREEVADVFAGQHPFINPPRTGAIAGFLLEKWLADCLE